MNRTWIAALSILAFAFALITVRKTLNSESQAVSEFGRSAVEKERIRNFWTAYHQATRLRSQGDFGKAAASYRQALEINPTHEESLYYLGNCLFEVGNYSEATKMYQRITQLNPASHRGFSQLGVTLSTPEPGAPLQLEQARKAFERNAEINKEESGPFLRLGLLALNQGNLQEALEQFNIAAGFRSPEGYFLAGYVCFRQQHYQQALDLFRRVLEMNAREKKISGRGILSEGDIKPASTQAARTPLEAAGMKSLIYLYWTAVRMGGYPAQVEPAFRLRGRDGIADRDLSRVVDLMRTGLKKDPRGRSAWADYDNDGDPDLAVVSPQGLLALYRNDGNKFTDVARSSGLAAASGGWDLCWGDYDGDGRQDLYVVGTGFIGEGQNTLYHNNPGGTFTDVTPQSGLGGKRSTARAFFFDYDRDGKLDLLEVGNGGAETPSLRLFRNYGGGRFREESERAGIKFEGNAVDCAIGDYDHDGFADLLVLRWKRPAILYRNTEKGSFADVTSAAGLAGLGGDGFSALFFDYDGDGRPDLLVTSHAPYELAVQQLIKPDSTHTQSTSRLFRNQRNGTFKEVTAEVGLNHCYGVMQAVAVDFDRDGWTDLVFANGGLEQQYLEPSVLLRNLKGKSFSPCLYLPSFNDPLNTSGAAAAVEKDGRVDLYLSGSGLYSIR